MAMFQPNSSALSGAGGTGKNYLSSYNNNPGNGDFEGASTAGFSLGTTGTLTNNLPTGSPSFGSGASGNLSLTLISSGQLAGTYSAGYVSSAATTAGNMLASSAFTIDKEDQAKRLSISIAYFAQTNPGNANWSGTSSNSLACAIYDVTNSAWIIPDKPFGFIQSGGVGQFTGTFQTSSNGTSYRLVVYNANATSGAVTVYFDDFVVGPTAASSASTVTSWNGTQVTQAVTANITNIAYATNLDRAGAWNGTQYVVPVAGDYLVCGSAQISAASQLIVFLNGSAYLNGNFGSPFTATAVSAGAVLVTGCKPNDLISVRCGGSVTVTNGNLGIFLIGSQPGFGSGGVVASKLNTISSTTVTANTALTFTTNEFDTNGSLSAFNKYTCAATGTYLITAFLDTAGSGGGGIYIAKNGTFTASAANKITVVSTTQGSGGAILLQCNAGDFLQIAANASYTAANTNANVSFSLVQPVSASSSAATEAASYWISANFAATTSIPINFDTKEFDTTACVTPSATVWKFTAKTTGIYSVAAYLVATGVTANQIMIYKNGSIYKNFGAANTNTAIFSTSATGIQLNAGDYIDIRPTANLTFVGGTLSSGLAGTIFIQRTG